MIPLQYYLTKEEKKKSKQIANYLQPLLEKGIKKQFWITTD